MQLFRFGVNVAGARSRTEWRETARKVEALGYDTLTVPDHLTDFVSPMPALLAAAEATTKLRVGTNVLNNDLRHPVLVAREAATIDLLTDGRVQLGLGAGSIKSECDDVGLQFDSGRIRVARLAESVAIIKRLWRGEEVTFAGQHYCINGHRIAPLPVQKPHPPLLIGGNGRQLLSLAAREADIVGFSGITFREGGAAAPDLSGWRAAAIDERVQLVREMADARWPALELNALVQRVIITGFRRKAAEELTSRWPQLTTDELLATPYLLIGTIDEIVTDLQVRRARWGFSHYIVRQPDLDAFAPVVACLGGR